MIIIARVRLRKPKILNACANYLENKIAGIVIAGFIINRRIKYDKDYKWLDL